jgi:hypothetical protein
MFLHRSLTLGGPMQGLIVVCILVLVVLASVFSRRSIVQAIVYGIAVTLGCFLVIVICGIIYNASIYFSATQFSKQSEYCTVKKVQRLDDVDFLMLETISGRKLFLQAPWPNCYQGQKLELKLNLHGYELVQAGRK